MDVSSACGYVPSNVGSYLASYLAIYNTAGQELAWTSPVRVCTLETSVAIYQVI